MKCYKFKINFTFYKHSNLVKVSKKIFLLFYSGVANILCTEGGITELKVLQAAILHDTVEDTETTIDEIEVNFGPEIRSHFLLVDKALNKLRAPTSLDFPRFLQFSKKTEVNVD